CSVQTVSVLSWVSVTGIWVVPSGLNNLTSVGSKLVGSTAWLNVRVAVDSPLVSVTGWLGDRAVTSRPSMSDLWTNSSPLGGAPGSPFIPFWFWSIGKLAMSLTSCGTVRVYTPGVVWELTRSTSHTVLFVAG